MITSKKLIWESIDTVMQEIAKDTSKRTNIQKFDELFENNDSFRMKMIQSIGKEYQQKKFKIKSKKQKRFDYNKFVLWLTKEQLDEFNSFLNETIKEIRNLKK